MRVALIGATGTVGSHVLEELVARSHDVIAIVRRPGAVAAGDRVTPVVADVHDTRRLTATLGGVGAVISAFNPGWEDPRLYEQFMSGARSIQSATKAAGVERLLVVGGASSLFVDNGRQLFDVKRYPDDIVDGVRAARDYHAEILDERELDWVFLSPPPGYGMDGLTERRGTYRVGADTPLLDQDGAFSSISGSDLALAIVDEIESPSHHRQRFTVAG